MTCNVFRCDELISYRDAMFAEWSSMFTFTHPYSRVFSKLFHAWNNLLANISRYLQCCLPNYFFYFTWIPHSLHSFNKRSLQALALYCQTRAFELCAVLRTILEERCEKQIIIISIF